MNGLVSARQLEVETGIPKRRIAKLLGKSKRFQSGGRNSKILYVRSEAESIIKSSFKEG